MLSSAVTPVCMVRSTLRNKLFSENKPAGIVHPAERNASRDLRATFQYLEEVFKKDGDRFFLRTWSNGTRDNGFKLKTIMGNKPRCCFYCLLYSAFGSPGSSFSQMQSWDCLHFHLITFILIYLCTLCPTYCWAVLVSLMCFTSLSENEHSSKIPCSFSQNSPCGNHHPK